MTTLFYLIFVTIIFMVWHKFESKGGCNLYVFGKFHYYFGILLCYPSIQEPTFCQLIGSEHTKANISDFIMGVFNFGFLTRKRSCEKSSAIWRIHKYLIKGCTQWYGPVFMIPGILCVPSNLPLEANYLMCSVNCIKFCHLASL